MWIIFLKFLFLLTLCHYNVASIVTYTFNGLQKSYVTPYTNGRILRTYLKEPSNNIASNARLLETTTPNVLNLINKNARIEANVPEYNFNYHVHDAATGDIKHHMEKRLGGNTSGYYTVLDADGFKRTVTYTADDENGFQAIVDRKPLLHNNALPIAATTYHNMASGMQFDSLYPTSSVSVPALVDNGAATDTSLLSVYQRPSLVTGVNTIYHHQIFDLPQQQQQPQQLQLQFFTENYQQNEQQQQQQHPLQHVEEPQPALDVHEIQMVSKRNESSSHNYHQLQNQQQQQQHQEQQQLQTYPGDQQFVLPYPQQQQQQQQQQHQQPTQQTEHNDVDDDSEIVEARFQIEPNNKQQ